MSMLLLAALVAPSGALWAATCTVESNNRSDAVNGSHVGVAQIGPSVVKDLQRAYPTVCFRLQHRWVPWRSREMWYLWLELQGRRYLRETGRQPTDETYARIWRSGFKGRGDAKSARYWRRVKATMKGGER
jgi:hypothetical protein